MRILTLGDSWTYGAESSDPDTMSWPAQMAKKYNVDVVNLARGGSSNQRAVRIGIEELCRDNKYDWVILPLGPASRTEILKLGKWYQIWPVLNYTKLNYTKIDKIFTEFWHPWNDVQVTMHLVLQFLSFVKLQGPKLFITGLSLAPTQYKKEMYWIENYKNDFNFESLDMPLLDFNIGIKDLDRKLKSLKAMHNTILEHQHEYFYDVKKQYLDVLGQTVYAEHGHPNDQGYQVLADYFAQKIKLI